MCFEKRLKCLGHERRSNRVETESKEGGTDDDDDADGSDTEDLRIDK